MIQQNGKSTQNYIGLTMFKPDAPYSIFIRHLHVNSHLFHHNTSHVDANNIIVVIINASHFHWKYLNSLKHLKTEKEISSSGSHLLLILSSFSRPVSLSYHSYLDIIINIVITPVNKHSHKFFIIPLCQTVSTTPTSFLSFVINRFNLYSPYAKKQKKIHGLKAQPLKDFICGSSPSLNKDC